MRAHARTFALVTAAALSLAACEQGPEEDVDGASSLQLALTATPADVRCIKLVVQAGRSITRWFDVTPGVTSSLQADGLPSGAATVYEEAFTVECSRARPGDQPAAWLSDPKSVVLAPGAAASVDLALRRAARLTVGSNFEECTNVTVFRDADGDGFGDPQQPSIACSAALPTGYVTTGTDCCDQDARAFPGQTAYDKTASACGGFDFDCDGAASPLREALFSGCSSSPSASWRDAVPACGLQGQLVQCARVPGGGIGGPPQFNITEQPVTQSCR